MGATMKGYDVFRARLLSLPAAVKEGMKADLVKSAEEVADTARALVPIAHGDLKASIKVTGPGGVTPLYSLGGSRKLDDLTAAVTVGNSSVRYAAHVEFGTKKMAPRPYMKPAWRLRARRIRLRLGRSMTKAVKRVFPS